MPLALPRLSWVAWVFGIILSVLIVALLANNALNLFVIAVLLVPPAIFLRVIVKRAREGVPPEHQLTDDKIVRFFATGFIPAACVAVIVEMILSLIFVLVLFAGNQAAAVDLVQPAAGSGSGSGSAGSAAGSVSGSTSGSGSGDAPGDALDTPAGASWFQVLAFLFLTAFVTAATVEEIAKVAIVRLKACPCAQQPMCVQTPPERSQARATLVYMLAGAVGFSTIENFGYTFSPLLTQKEGEYDFWMFVLLAVVRAFVALPTHSLCAAMTAARMVHMDRTTAQLVLQGKNPSAAPSWAWVLFPAVLVHGTYDFQAMGLSVVLAEPLGAVGATIVTLVLGITVLCLGGVAFRYQWKMYAEPNGLGSGDFMVPVPQNWAMSPYAGGPGAAGAATGPMVVLPPGATRVDMGPDGQLRPGYGPPAPTDASAHHTVVSVAPSSSTAAASSTAPHATGAASATGAGTATGTAGAPAQVFLPASSEGGGGEGRGGGEGGEGRAR